MIYLDACLVIDLIERHPLWGDEIARLLVQFGGERFGISPLAKCECLVGPISDANPILQRTYGVLFGRLVSLAMPEAVSLQAAELRARFGLKTPDALHLACVAMRASSLLRLRAERARGRARCAMLLPW